jgi:hypothetical protein
MDFLTRLLLMGCWHSCLQDCMAVWRNCPPEVRNLLYQISHNWLRSEVLLTWPAKITTIWSTAPPTKGEHPRLLLVFPSCYIVRFIYRAQRKRLGQIWWFDGYSSFSCKRVLFEGHTFISLSLGIIPKSPFKAAGNRSVKLDCRMK